MPEFKKLPGDLDVDPAEVFRPRQAQKYFGFCHSTIYEKVKTGEIPAPFPLSENGAAVAWTGRQLIEHHRRRVAAAEKRSKTATP